MRWQRAAEWQRKKSGDAARGELLDVPVLPIVTMFVVAMYLTDLRPLLLPAAGAALWGLVKLRARVSQSIADVVLQSPTEAYADAAPHTVLESAHTVEPATSPLASSLRLEMLDMRKPGLLPAPTAASQARLDAVRQRPITMRAHFRRGVLTAAGLTLLFAVTGWLIGTPEFPVNTAMLVAATIVGLGRTGGAFIRAFVGFVVARLLLGPFVSIAGLAAGGDGVSGGAKKAAKKATKAVKKGGKKR